MFSSYNYLEIFIGMLIKTRQKSHIILKYLLLYWQHKIKEIYTRIHMSQRCQPRCQQPNQASFVLDGFNWFRLTTDLTSIDLIWQSERFASTVIINIIYIHTPFSKFCPHHRVIRAYRLQTLLSYLRSTHFFYRQLGCLAFSLRFRPKI